MAYAWNDETHKLVCYWGNIKEGWREVSVQQASILLAQFPGTILAGFPFVDTPESQPTVNTDNPTTFDDYVAGAKIYIGAYGSNVGKGQYWSYCSLRDITLGDFNTMWDTAIEQSGSAQPTPIPPVPVFQSPNLGAFNGYNIRRAWIDLLKEEWDKHEDEDGVYEAFYEKAKREDYDNSWIDAHWEYLMTNSLVKRKTVKPKTPFLQKTFKEAFSRQKFARVSGEIGIEIEAEGKNLFTTPIQYWGAVQDHSLRQVDGHPPIEYVLREPIERKDVMPALVYLEDRLKRAGSELRMSHRCSVHVHINVQEMQMMHLLNFMCLYYIFENIFIEWSGPDRKGNLFCLRAQDAEYQTELIVNALKKDRWQEAFSQEFRYAAMNVASLGKHGSLEFRSMRGNVDIHFIEHWVRVLCWLKDVSTKFKNPEELSDKFRQLGPREFFREILVKEFGNRFTACLNYQNFDQMMWDSYRSMRDIAHAVDWNDPPAHMLKTARTRKTTYTEPVPLEDFYEPEYEPENGEDNF